MKLSSIRSLIVLFLISFLVACNPSVPNTDDTNKGGLPAEDTEEQEEEVVDLSPVIGFTAVDFKAVPDDYFSTGANLVIGIAAEFSDPDGDDDIVQAGFLFSDPNGSSYRVDLKNIKDSTPVDDRVDYFDEDLGLHYSTWYSFPNSITYDYWNIEGLSFFAIDASGNQTVKSYRVDLPNGDSGLFKTHVYHRDYYGGDTTDGIASLATPTVSKFEIDMNDTIALEFTGMDTRIQETIALFTWFDGTDFQTKNVTLSDVNYDGTTQSYTIADGDITLADGFGNADITSLRFLVKDDPEQNKPDMANWWHYETVSDAVDITTL